MIFGLLVPGRWRGRPLTNHQVIVDLIANTSTTTGLVVQCVLDTGPYPTGVRYTDKTSRPSRWSATTSIANGTTPSTRTD